MLLVFDDGAVVRGLTALFWLQFVALNSVCPDELTQENTSAFAAEQQATNSKDTQDLFVKLSISLV